MGALLPEDTRIGLVSLTVGDLGRSVDFYQNSLGLALLDKAGGVARLGAGETEWLELVESPGATKPRKTTGLYHFAVLLPSRVELAQTLRRLALRSAPFEGAADHGVSEAIYLHDPDGTGIEIYRDRTAAEWPRDADGGIEMTTDPLDLDALIDELQDLPEDWAGMPAETRVGHVHLHVSNLARAELFYTGTVGLDLMQRYGPSAAFLSAGGYHHHVGINTWNGTNAPTPPPGSAGLRYFEIVVPDAAARAALVGRLDPALAEERDGRVFTQDPAGNGIAFA